MSSSSPPAPTSLYWGSSASMADSEGHSHYSPSGEESASRSAFLDGHDPSQSPSPVSVPVLGLTSSQMSPPDPPLGNLPLESARMDDDFYGGVERLLSMPPPSFSQPSRSHSQAEAEIRRNKAELRNLTNRQVGSEVNTKAVKSRIDTGKKVPTKKKGKRRGSGSSASGSSTSALDMSLVEEAFRYASNLSTITALEDAVEPAPIAPPRTIVPYSPTILAAPRPRIFRQPTLQTLSRQPELSAVPEGKERRQGRRNLPSPR